MNGVFALLDLGHWPACLCQPTAPRLGSRHKILSTKPRCSEAFSCGWQAAVSGVSRRNNPHRRDTPQWHEWHAGWLKGDNWR